MHTHAVAKYIRISPRKVQSRLSLIKGLDITHARAQLQRSSSKASAILLDVLNSAAANALNNEDAREDTIRVHRAFVDQGPTLKRWRARAFGRAAAIRKRTSHITVVVEFEKKETRKKTANESAQAPAKKEALGRVDAGHKKTLPTSRVKKHAHTTQKNTGKKDSAPTPKKKNLGAKRDEN